jgi:excisionase family DNA binding protein
MPRDPSSTTFESIVRKIVREEIAPVLAIIRPEGSSRPGGEGTPMAMSLEEASKASGLGHSLLKAAIRDGQLRTVRHGRRRLVLPEDLKAFVEAGSPR